MSTGQQPTQDQRLALLSRRIVFVAGIVLLVAGVLLIMNGQVGIGIALIVVAFLAVMGLVLFTVLRGGLAPVGQGRGRGPIARSSLRTRRRRAMRSSRRR
jgi:hypothetical protein